MSTKTSWIPAIAVGLTGWVLATVLAAVLASQIHDHDTAVIVAIAVGGFGGIPAGLGACVMFLWRNP